VQTTPLDAAAAEENGDDQLIDDKPQPDIDME